MKDRLHTSDLPVMKLGRTGWERQAARSMIIFCLLIVLSGCAGASLAPTPNLYVGSNENPYANLPKELQTSSATILYATDREPLVTKDVFGYGTKRSREIAFGQCTVEIGENTTWEQLVAASRSRKRSSEQPLALGAIHVRGHYPAIPPMVQVGDRWVEDPEYLSGAAAATREIHHLLAEHLANTPTKEVFIFVHGFNNDFPYAAFTTAQLWHFMGRSGVPVLYSWPAGSRGLLRGYTHDRESGEFTNAHLKSFIRAIASCPDVAKVHLVGHSRGTDVLATALRELHLECRGAGKDTRAELKLGQVVLVAPDIDLDVFVERFSADRTGFVPERLTIYVSPTDKAIGLASWLFGSVRRIGRATLGDLGGDLASFVKKHPIVNVVDVRAKTIGAGHNYFITCPEALSDVILVLRDHRAPGAANGRPLFDNKGGFWEIHDGYPNNVRKSKSPSDTDQAAAAP